MVVLARRRARTPEARENQLMELAVDLAEKQLSEGTASAMLVTHYVKMASQRARLEQEKLRKEIALIDAKTNAYESDQRNNEMYQRALKAFSLYSGHPDDDGDDEW